MKDDEQVIEIDLQDVCMVILCIGLVIVMIIGAWGAK